MSYALITGGNKGIGKAIAEELARRKYDLLLIARSEDSLRAETERLTATYGVRADYFVLDLSSLSAAAALHEWCVLKKYAISILVNNAGYGLSGAFEKYSAGDHAAMMQVNMLSLVQICRLFLPALREQPKSYILNIASTAAYQAVPFLGTYSATKAFVLSFSRALREELRRSPVSVSCVCPGATDTGFASRAMIGKKGLKAAEKTNMTADAVARQAVITMFSGKAEKITGGINRLGAFLVWLLPKSLVEKTAMKLYQ
jgi:short-subunit dehydrogenase